MGLNLIGPSGQPSDKVPPQLESERLLLRVFELRDAPDVQRLAGAFEIADTTLAIPHPYEDGLAEQWIRYLERSAHEGTDLTFAITRKDDAILVGAISLMDVVPHHQAEVGYWIGCPYWGSGYCTEAGRKVVEYAFETMHLVRLHARHMTRNPASGRVLEKLGFRHEGRRLAHVLKWGQPEDVDEYGMLRDARLR